MVELTAYEKLRQENILRNSEFLKLLGLDEVETGKADHASPKKGTKKTERIHTRESPKRFSKRLQKLHNSGNENLSDSEGDSIENQKEYEPEVQGIDYEEMPIESSELDDAEFAAFLLVRKWRMQKAKEEDVEPYKIFQNRTIFEAIRRLRNDASWAEPASPNRSAELRECWGIGSSKSKPGGLAEQLLEELSSPEAIELLKKSRAQTNVSAGEEDEAKVAGDGSRKRRRSKSFQN